MSTNSEKYDNVNGILIVELQCFASKYDVGYLYSVGLPEGEMGYIFKVSNIYEVYLNHCLQRQIVLNFRNMECSNEEELSDDNKATYFGLLDERNNIVKCLESLLATDRDVVYLVLLHEIGHKELGHVKEFECPILEELSASQSDLYNKLFSEQFLKIWRLDVDAENWAIAEFKRLKVEGML